MHEPPTLAESIRRRADQFTFVCTLLAVTLPVISIAASQIFLLLASIGFLLEWVLNKGAKPNFPPIKVPLLLFMATTFVAYLLSPEPQIGSPPLRKFVLFVIILLVVNKLSKPRVIQTYHALFTIGVVAAGFSICQYIFRFRGSIDNRLTGFMGHWMTLSGEMMLVFMALATYFVFLNPAKKIPWSVAFCVVGISLALTLTRSVWMATLAGLVVILWLRHPHWKTLALTAMACTLLFLGAPQFLRDRVRSIFDMQDPSNYARAVIWKAGWRMVKAHPWTGVGPQRVFKVFYDYHPHSNDRTRDGFFPVHMHNNLLQFAAERGIPCALAWLWLMLKMAWDHWSGFRKAKGESETQAIRAIGVVSVFVLFLAGLFEFNFGDSEVLMIFLFLVSAPYAVAPDVSKGISAS
jgi:putative inorganic carbon (hco3(-)) transporter